MSIEDWVIKVKTLRQGYKLKFYIVLEVRVPKRGFGMYTLGFKLFVHKFLFFVLIYLRSCRCTILLFENVGNFY